MAHSIYGIATTINAANYVIFIALEKVLDLNHPEVVYIQNCFICKFLIICCVILIGYPSLYGTNIGIT